MKKALLSLLITTLAWSCTGSKTYTVVPDQGDCTAAIQAKLDKCFLKGGGTVILKEGEYHVGGIRVRSNTTLYLKSGAKLIGSRDCMDYRIMAEDRIEALDPEDCCSDSLVYIPPRLRKGGKNIVLATAGSRWNDGIIRIYKAHDVAIIGEDGSCIDGCNSYDVQGEESYRGVHGISVHKSRNLKFRGYTIQHTGNWAHQVRQCRNLEFRDLEIIAGHDGIHISSCDSVLIADCIMKTGDDCVAGFDNQDILVQRCTLNTACSAFRFGGTRFLAEDCLCYGPAEYLFRGSLSKEEKKSGAMSGQNERRNMLSLFTYYADKSLDIRQKPGDICFKNIECKDVDRFIHYNFSGNETWQLGMPLDSVKFQNVTATGTKLPLCTYSEEHTPFLIEIKDCKISFKDNVPEIIRGAYMGEIRIDGLEISGTDPETVLLRNWKGEQPALNIKGLSGAKAKVETATAPFSVRAI